MIRFVSTGVTPTVDGFQVQGRLTLAGQTREVSCDIAPRSGRTRCGRAAISRLKTDGLRIRPYRGGPAGTVRVADRVTFSFEAVGIRSTGP